MTKDKLKPCPFCGRKPVIEESAISAIPSYYVCCSIDNQCFMWLVRTDSYRTEQQAVSAFNRRVG